MELGKLILRFTWENNYIRITRKKRNFEKSSEGV